MSQLQELTDDQRVVARQIGDRWWNVCLSTGEIEKGVAIPAVIEIYKARNVPVPDRFLFTASPFSGAVVADVIKSQTENDGRWPKKMVTMKDHDIIKWAEENSAKIFNGEKTVTKVQRDGIRDRMDEMVFGSLDGNWIMHFDMARYLGWDKGYWTKVEPLARLAESCGWWAAYTVCCIMQDRPVMTSVNDKCQPHNANGPYWKWRDELGLYAINGVRVPSWLPNTPAEKIHGKRVVEERNAEVRREIVRKIGIGKLCKDLKAKPLDTYGNYRLLEVDTGNGRRYPMLEMVNPSIGTIHIEGVPPGIDTCLKALYWRNGIEELPETLS